MPKACQKHIKKCIIMLTMLDVLQTQTKRRRSCLSYRMGVAPYQEGTMRVPGGGYKTEHLPFLLLFLLFSLPSLSLIPLPSLVPSLFSFNSYIR